MLSILSPCSIRPSDPSTADLAQTIVLTVVLALLPTSLLASVTFSGEATIRSGLDGASNVISADLDGDGFPDVVGIGDEVTYALNGGDGSTWTTVDLTANPGRGRQLVAADLDGDDDLDIVYTAYDDDKVYRFTNNLDTSGTFSGRTTITTLDWADGIDAGDLDGDGDIDLAATSRQGDTYWWIENTNGSGTSWTLRVVAQPLDGAQIVAIGDLDGDGDLDLVGGGAEDEPRLVWIENVDAADGGPGDASEWSVHEIDVGWINGIALADLDLDGDLDIVVSENDAATQGGSANDQVVWWENVDGDASTWTDLVLGGAGNNATDGVQVVDLDLDGDLDVVANRNGDWFENANGSATNWTRHSYSDANEIDDHDVADLDRDGDLDIVGARLERDRLARWLSQLCVSTDMDSDGDGARDPCDVCDGFDDFLDADGDTVPDGCDTCAGGDDRVDVDANGTPDACQATGTLAIDDVTMAEGSADTTDFVFTVTLTGDVEEPFTVDYATEDGTATTADGDYAATSGTLAFAGNDGETRTITVSVAGDTTPEGDETFRVELDDLSTLFAEIDDDTGIGTIEEDDIVLSIDDIATVEGDSGTTDLVFTVTLTGDAGGAFTVDVSTQDDTATAGSDYASASATLSFAGTDGETETFTVSVTGDTALEGDETFEAVLGTPSDPRVGIGDGTGVGTIEDDDSASVSIDDFSTAEGDDGTTVFVFIATLSGDVQGGFTVDVETMDDTATAASGDYTADSATLTFAGADGETESFAVEVAGDLAVEDDETFTVELDTPSAAGVVLADGVGLGTIENDDTASISIDDVTAAEGDAGTTDFTFSVTLSNAVQGGFTVDAQTTDGTAIAGSDYAATSDTLTFAGAAGETQLFTVGVTGDTVVEPDETFSAVLGTPSKSDVGVSEDTGVATITNDDAATLSIDDVTVVEGDAGTTDLVFTVTLSGSVQGGFTFDAQTQDGAMGDTAAIAGSDYTAASGTLSFTGTDGETRTFTVDATGDTVVEGDETFSVVLGTPSNSDVAVSDGTGTGTITNDDSAALSIGDATVVEGDAGTTDLVFTVTLSGDVQGGVTVEVQTQDGAMGDTATAGDDYSSTSDTLSFDGTDGETETFTVAVTGDTVVEGDETLSAVLGTPSNGAVGVADGTGVGTIVGDDSATLSIDDVAQLEGDAGSTLFTFTVTLIGTVDSSVQVGFATRDGTATTADDDYDASTGALSFDGFDGETETISIAVTGDTISEGDESFFVDLTSSSNPRVTFTDAAGEGTILGDDARGTLTVDFAGDSGSGDLGAVVTSSPGGIDCNSSTSGPSCAASFPTGVAIELSVDTDIDTNFDGWSGDPDCADGIVTFAADGETADCTANLSPRMLLFSDDFESGDISAWSEVFGSSGP